jgi:hypothetical protein
VDTVGADDVHMFLDGFQIGHLRFSVAQRRTPPTVTSSAAPWSGASALRFRRALFFRFAILQLDIAAQNSSVPSG